MDARPAQRCGVADQLVGDVSGPAAQCSRGAGERRQPDAQDRRGELPLRARGHRACEVQGGAHHRHGSERGHAPRVGQSAVLPDQPCEQRWRQLHHADRYELRDRSLGTHSPRRHRRPRAGAGQRCRHGECAPQPARGAGHRLLRPAQRRRPGEAARRHDQGLSRTPCNSPRTASTAASRSPPT